MRLMSASTNAPRHPLVPSLPMPTWGDLVAAVTVALLLIPQCLAYAELAGLPAHVGLIAAAVPPVIAGAFGKQHLRGKGIKHWLITVFLNSHQYKINVCLCEQKDYHGQRLRKIVQHLRSVRPWRSC